MGAHPASTGASPQEGHWDRRELRIRLAGLLRASDEMLAHAREGDWDWVAALEEKRRPLLEACIAQALEAEDEPLFVEAIATIKHQNDEVVELVAEARRQAVEERRGLKAARSAGSLYRQNGQE